MNRYLLYSIGMWGFWIALGCIINLYKYNINNKYTIYSWLVFGIIGGIVHSAMFTIRNNPDKNKAIALPGIESWKQSTRLIACTIGQIIVLSLYLYTRHNFIIKWPTDIFAILIIMTMGLRLFYFVINDFKFTEKMLYKNVQGDYV